MSKETPEVGDVWENKQSKTVFAIIYFNPRSKDFIGYNTKTKTIRLFDALSPMPIQFEYIGKAKGLIDDLFEVKE